MKVLNKLLFLGLILSIFCSNSLLAMETKEEIAPAAETKPMPINFGTPIEKPCCCILCIPSFIKCCCSCVSCSIKHGDVAIKIGEAIALPFPEAEIILLILDQMFKVSKIHLYELADKCKKSGETLSADFVAALLKHNIDIRPYINTDGTVKPELAAVANETIKVQDATSRGGDPIVHISLCSAPEMYNGFLSKRMLYQVAE